MPVFWYYLDMSYYVIIRGPAGVGKTTIAKSLEEKLGAVYISFDEVLEKYKLEMSDGRGIAKESFLKANQMVVNDAKKELENGKIVIMDGYFYHKDQLEDLEKSLPFEHYIFDLKATVEECIARDKLRKSIGENSVRAVHTMVSEFDYGVSIETGGKTVEGVVKEILGLLKISVSKYII
jgi:predicted kinase